MTENHIDAEKDYMSGMKYQEIADKYNVTINTVKSWKKRYAWERKKGAHKNEKGCTQNKKVQPVHSVPIDDGTKDTLKNDSLTPEQQMFCIYYSRTFNASQSYQKAYGCTYESAMSAGTRLLSNVRVKEELERLKDIKRQQIVASEPDLVELQMRIAFGDIGNYLSFGSKEIHDEETGEDFKVSTINLNNSDNADTQIIQEVKKGKDGISIKLADKQKAIDWLSKYFLVHPEDRYKAEFDKLKLEQEKGTTDAKVVIIDDIPRE